MSELESWLTRATRGLSRSSATQVRAEIQEHYDSARAAAMGGGETGEQADRSALAALGEAKEANRQYRKVLLTSSEARVLGEGNWEAREVCSRSWLRWLSAAVLVAALALFYAGATDVARVVFIAGVGMSLMFTASILPVYTPWRGRIFRVVKWVVLCGAFLVAFGPETEKFAWLMITCLWPLVWIEWTRAAIRRKLRVADWPKQLYL